MSEEVEVDSVHPPQVVIVGPNGSEILADPIRSALLARGCAVDAYYGASTGVIDPAVWADTDLAVWLAIACDEAIMDAAPKLRAIIVPTIGHEFVDLAAASERAILVANGRVAENYESVAETAVLFMLASLYDLHGAEAELRGQGVRGVARMLRGRTIGLIGYGNIAQCLVRRLEGWGVRILVHRRKTGAPDPRFVQTSLDVLLGEADVVVILASLNAESWHMIGAAELAKMKDDAILINLSRGALVDEAALARHVARGKLAKVALDAFEVEPLPEDSPLRALPNAILTPHAIAHSRESFAAIPPMAVANALSALRGDMPDSTVNPDVEGHWRVRFPEGWNMADVEAMADGAHSSARHGSSVS